MCAAAAAHSRVLRASIAGARVRRITTVTADQRPDARHYEPTALTGKRAVGHSVNPRPTGRTRSSRLQPSVQERKDGWFFWWTAPPHALEKSLPSVHAFVAEVTE